MEPALLVMDVNRKTGEPCWNYPLIDAYSEKGYIVRLENYLFSFKNTTIDSDLSTELWDLQDIKQQIRNLRSNDQKILNEAKMFFQENIKWFLSKIDGVVESKVEISNGEIDISFLAEIRSIDKIKEIKRQYNIGSLVK